MTDLSFARLSELAPAPNWPLIDRYLPEPYRRALSQFDNPMQRLTKSSRDALRRINNELELVQKSRAVDYFSDLADGRLLGAMHAQEPWPEEDTDAFRARLKGVAALAVDGAANARRFLDVAALASSSDVVDVIPPSTEYSVSDGATTIAGTTVAGQFKGILRKPQGVLLDADVIDAPPRIFAEDITPRGVKSFLFSVHNPARSNLPDLLSTNEPLYSNPLITIEAKAKIGPLAFVQRDTQRIVVINRVLPAGSIIRVDLERMAWENANPERPSTLGTITLDGAKEALYAGITSTTEDRFFVNEATVDDGAAGYALDMRRVRDLEITQSLKDQMIERGNTAVLSPMVMPSWLGAGQSRWRLLSVDPAVAGQTDVHARTFTPLDADAPVKLRFEWIGRRTGEFAVRVDDTALAPDTNGPLSHRLTWLDQMVERFKLGGTVRIANDLLANPDEFGVTTVTFDMSDRLRLTDGVELFDGFRFTSSVTPKDSLSLNPESEIRLESRVIPVDAITLSSDQISFDFSDTLKPRAGLSLAPQLELALAEATTPLDEVALSANALLIDEVVKPEATLALDVTPIAAFDFADETKPVVTVALDITETAEFFWAETVAPMDSLDVSVTEMAQFGFDAVVRPGAEVEVDFQDSDPPEPGEGPVTDNDIGVVPQPNPGDGQRRRRAGLNLTSRIEPTDTIRLNRRRPTQPGRNRRRDP